MKALHLLVPIMGISLIVVGVLIYMNSDRVTPDEENWFVRVHGMVGNETDIHMGEFKTLNTSLFSMALEGTGEDGKEHDYRGITLLELIEGQNVHENATKVTVRAADGYSRSFSISDLDGGILLVYEKDGKELEGRSEGGEGPIRLIVSQEHAGTFNAQYSVKWVSEVVVS